MSDAFAAGDSGQRSPADGPAGLCPSCQHVKIVVSERGSKFLRCRLASAGSTFRKYPPQPVRQCPGYEA